MNFLGDNMLKKQIKKQIKKTIMYQTLEQEKNLLKNQVDTLQKDQENLLNQIKNLQKEVQNLKNQVNNQQNREKDHERLINALKAENKSIKDIYLENDIPNYDYNDLTIILPYRKTDDPVREENLDIKLRYLNKIGLKNIIISEHSDNSEADFLIDRYGNLFDSFKVIFNNANGELFNKSLAINKGVIESKTKYIGISDIDCLTENKNVNKSIKLLNKGFEVVHPFNRVINDIVDKDKFKQEYDFKTVDSPKQYRDWADGGIVFWNKEAFISIGMKNENFNGWGGEDNEILIRARLFQLKQIRIDETLYHLYHERPQIRTKNNVEQLEKIEQIKDEKDLLNEIKGWEWAN